MPLAEKRPIARPPMPPAITTSERLTAVDGPCLGIHVEKGELLAVAEVQA
jgi:hypothetical protein